MITGKADAAVYDREGKLILVVETKSRFGVTQRWAARTFRNLYVHGSVPDVPYFLLALPDAFYLWRDPGRKALEAFVKDEREEVMPDYAVPAWGAIRPYLGGNDVSPNELSTYSIAMIVNAFFADLLNNYSDLSRESAPAHLLWLFDSGLYEAIRGGTLASQSPI
jgi:hypothetical protein